MSDSITSHENLDIAEQLQARHLKTQVADAAEPAVSWWPNHETFNWWGARPEHYDDVTDLEKPEPRSIRWLETSSWVIQYINKHNLLRTLNTKRTPSRYHFSDVVSLEVIWDDQADSFEWEVENQPTNIAFIVSHSYSVSPATHADAEAFCMHYKRASEVADWLRTDPVVQGKRISQQRADFVNSVYGAQRDHDKEMLRQRVADRAFTRPEAASLLETLKKRAIIEMGATPMWGASATTGINLLYRDGIEHTQGQHRKLVCHVTVMQKETLSDAPRFKACFYWGTYTKGRPTARKTIMSDLQQSYSWAKNQPLAFLTI